MEAGAISNVETRDLETRDLETRDLETRDLDNLIFKAIYPSTKMSTEARCKRISRVCCKISELLNHEIEGDLEEFLSNIQSIFLVLCEHLHADTDCLEMFSGGDRCSDVYDITHCHIEALYGQLVQTVTRNRASLAYETKEWFTDEHSTAELSGRFPSLMESPKASRFLSLMESPKGTRRPASPVIANKIVNALLSTLERSAELSTSAEGLRTTDP